MTRLNMEKIITDVLWVCGSLVHSLWRYCLWSKDGCLFLIIQVSIQISTPQRGFLNRCFCCWVIKSYQLYVSPCQAPLSSTTSQSLHKLVYSESVMSSNHLILCHPLLLLPSIFPKIRVFFKESVLRIRWPEYWSFSFSKLISFKMDWVDLPAVQGILKSLLLYHSSKPSILQHSAFFIVQLSHSYMITGKIIALTKRTFVGKVMSLLFNMLSRSVIAFLPRSKRLLISWLQSPSAVILEPKKIKSFTVSIVSPSICH